MVPDVPEAGGIRRASDTAWIATGDTGLMEHEQIAVVGRSRDWIAIDGRNIRCSEIEAAIDAVSGIARAIAVNCGASSMFRAHRRTDTFAVLFVPDDAVNSDPAVLAKSARNAVALAFGAGPIWFRRSWRLAFRGLPWARSNVAYSRPVSKPERSSMKRYCSGRAAAKERSAGLQAMLAQLLT